MRRGVLDLGVEGHGDQASGFVVDKGGADVLVGRVGEVAVGPVEQVVVLGREDGVGIAEERGGDAVLVAGGGVVEPDGAGEAVVLGFAVGDPA